MIENSKEEEADFYKMIDGLDDSSSEKDQIQPNIEKINKNP